jgi:hypothetical protein
MRWNIWSVILPLSDTSSERSGVIPVTFMAGLMMKSYAVSASYRIRLFLSRFCYRGRDLGRPFWDACSVTHHKHSAFGRVETGIDEIT